MKTLRFASLAGLLLLVSTAAFAADVSGKWVAEMTGRDGEPMQVTFNFTQNGEKLTGTVTGRMGEREISEGKVSGDEISFAQVMEFQGNTMKILYKGKISGNEIKFTRQREGAERTQEFTAKKAS